MEIQNMPKQAFSLPLHVRGDWSSPNLCSNEYIEQIDYEKNIDKSRSPSKTAKNLENSPKCNEGGIFIFTSDFTSYILLLNGIYDITCAVSIMWFSKYPILIQFSKLHTDMFLQKNDSDNPILRRFTSYWLITYGSIRCFAGVNQTIETYIIAAITYFIEALCYSYENHYGNTLYYYKALFVSILSLIIGIFVLLTLPKNKKD